MAPTDNKENLPSKESKSQTVQDQLDLDKNPIKYATHEPGKFTLNPHDKPYMELTLRHGKHSDIVQKILRQRVEARAKDFPRWPGEETSGVRLMWIESRFWYDRERLSPDFDGDWRRYRANYLHSLNLHPTEPIHVPEYETVTLNPLRRLFHKPGDWIEKHLISRVAKDQYNSSLIRFVVSRYFLIWLGSMTMYYYVRYHHTDWTKMGGITIMKSKPTTYPGHGKYFPFPDYKNEGAHHWLHGFPQRPIYKDLRYYDDITQAL